MTSPLRNAFVLFALGLTAVIQPGASAAKSEEYSASNPPPASFAFAGPVGGMVDDTGKATVFFRYVAIVHSLDPTRVQVLDADSGAVLVDDQNPTLQQTPYKHPSKPGVHIYQWEGRSPPETITDTEPAWLHD